jgi:hypothetical protein
MPPHRWALFGTAALMLALLAGFVGCGRSPQIGADAEAFAAVDALFTTVTARDERLLNQCETRLHALRDAGRLPARAARRLDDVIQRARGGRWESAARRLYDFMAAQRR